jgi:hypothetical protein
MVSVSLLDFSFVKCLFLQEIKAGAEVLVNYEYSFDEAPPWSVYHLFKIQHPNERIYCRYMYVAISAVKGRRECRLTYCTIPYLGSI